MTENKQNNKWSDSEVKILVDYYSDNGSKFCSELLNRPLNSVKQKINRLGLKINENKRYIKDTFTEVVKESINYVDVCRNLNLNPTMGNRQTIKKYIKLYNLDISHFRNGKPKPSNKKKLDEILVENSTYLHTSNLRDRLYKDNLKNRECEMCGQSEEWKGEKMSLILDHINGVHDDNRLENLRIVCPNCNATLSTHGGKNINNGPLV